MNGRWVTIGEGEGDLMECGVHVDGDGEKVTGGRKAAGEVLV